MTTLYVLVGLQGSGKSTWARRFAPRLGAEIVASDEIRNELEAEGHDASDGDRVFSIFEQRVAALLDAGRSVVADATHARRRWRHNVLALARERKVRRVAVWFDVPLADALARNARKPGGPRWGDRVVPRHVLADMARNFEPPGEDEFDQIWKLSLIDVTS